MHCDDDDNDDDANDEDDNDNEDDTPFSLSEYICMHAGMYIYIYTQRCMCVYVFTDVHMHPTHCMYFQKQSLRHDVYILCFPIDKKEQNRFSRSEKIHHSLLHF